ncbi:MAG: serine hydrolase [Syntrophomonadaceae bacterium]|nr:serine hydrolase [Syntrophomonadaceae bacterium]
MDLKMQTNAVKLVWSILDRRHNTTPIIPPYPHKTKFPEEGALEQPFPRCTPEEQGISSHYVADFLDELQKERGLDMHSIMILRNGQVIAEGDFGAYRSDVWHVTHSLCKSITGLAIGMMIDEKRLALDDKVVKLLERRAPALASLTFKNVTVRHLLTMSSGVNFGEGGAVTEENWVKCYLESIPRGEPDTDFAYNSMNSYILGAIIKEITGYGLTAYLKERLWKPLGITKVYWERCPKGLEKGGWGLYMCPEDMAKIGQLYLQKGNWQGRQLVSEQWIKDATTAQIATPQSFGAYDYGYHIWVGREEKSFLLNGMFGQNIIGYPDKQLLLVTTAGNNAIFQRSSYFALAHRYFGAGFVPGEPLREDPGAQKHLAKITQGLYRRPRGGKIMKFFSAEPLPKQCLILSGREYELDRRQTMNVGVFPLLAQALQNNYTTGLCELGFDIEDNVFYITLAEKDQSFRLPVGFDTPQYADITVHGEPYKVGITGQFATDEDDTPVLKLRLSFLELSNARLIKIFFYGERIRLGMSEMPDQRAPLGALRLALKQNPNNKFIEALLSRVDDDYLVYKIERALAPTVSGMLVPEPPDA